jgi:hypothetical protein
MKPWGILAVLSAASSFCAVSSASAAAATTSHATSRTSLAQRTARGVSLSPTSYPTITFNDVPLGTDVTNQYESNGVVFTSAVHTETDGANPTSPVLSGDPTFEGEINGSFVNPATGAPQTVTSFTLDVGYIDNRDSVVVEAWDADGNRVQSVIAEEYGINTLTLTYRGMAGFSVHEVAEEPAGFAIDNLSIDATGDPQAVESVASMGDSYSSGEGLLLGKGTNYDCGTDVEAGLYYQDTTLPFLLSRPWSPQDCDTRTLSNTEPNLFSRPPTYYENTCHRNALAYPVEIGRMLRASGSIFVACSGATTANVGEIAWTAGPQHANSPVNIAGGNTQVTDVVNFDADHLAGGNPDLITIGIGGNDAGFSSVVKSCIVTINPCSNDEKFADTVLNKIKGPVYRALEETFTGLRADFPSSTIVAFGYVSPVAPDAPFCAGAPFFASDREFLDETVLPMLNQAIADAADAAGISFVDISRVTEGHEVCTADPWFRGLSYPIAQSFHPTQDAHKAIAEYFKDHYTDGHGNLLIHNPPFAGSPIPPVQSGTVGAIADLTGGPRAPCGPGCLQAMPCIQSCSVLIQGSGYSPQAQLEAILHSNAYDLGPVTADVEGNVNAIVQIPEGVPPGEHIITLDGTGPDDSPQYGSLGLDILEASASTPPSSSPSGPGGPSAHEPSGVDGVVSNKTVRRAVRTVVVLHRRGERLTATLTCPRDAASTCSVTLTLQRVRRVAGHRRSLQLRRITVHVGVGKTRPVTLRNPAIATARRQLRLAVKTTTSAGILLQTLGIPR